MSLKNLLSASLLCIVASPALADPTLTVGGGGLSGPNRVWTVSVTPSPVNTALAFELGFRTVGGNFLSIVPNPASPAAGTTPVEFLTPGNKIFGWEAVTPPPTGNNQPEGIQIGTAGNADEAFVAVGTNILATAGPHQILTITTQAAVTSLQWGGIYNANGTLGTPGVNFNTGLIAQENAGGNAIPFYGFSGTRPIPVGAIAGDYNGNGTVELGDFNLVVANWGGAVPPIPGAWTGDPPTGPQVDLDDFNKVVANWGDTTGASTALGVNVPEPASFILGGLVIAATAMFRRRRIG